MTISALFSDDKDPGTKARPQTRTITIRNFPEEEYQLLRREVLERRADGETVIVSEVVVEALAERRERRGPRAARNRH